MPTEPAEKRIPLTEKLIRDLDLSDLEGKSEKRFWEPDQDGLCLRVRARGKEITRCYWVHYRFLNTDKKLAIGSTSETTLADARHRAYEIRRDAKDGIDPRVRLRQKSAQTLSQAVTAYLADLKLMEKSKSTDRQAKLYLQGSYFKPLHTSGIDRITQKDVANCLTTIKTKHSVSTAHVARSILHRLYVWLNQQGSFPQACYNPVQGTRPPADRKFMESRRRRRALTDVELVEVWNKSGEKSGRYGQIIRLLILTGCRREEVGGMRKAELDFANRTWTIPAIRYKTRKDHTVYLCKAAVEIIEAALKVAPTEGVFETIKVGKAGRPRRVPGFQDWSHDKKQLDAALGNTVAKWVVHDLRRTMRSGLGKLGVVRDVAEMALGHAQPVIVDIYDQHPYADELRNAYERWATHIEQLLGTNVVELRRA